MKRKAIFMMGAVTGLAVAGLAAYLFNSDKTRDAAQRLKKDGKRMIKDLEDIVKETREKINEVKEAIKSECAESQTEKEKRA